MSRDVEVGTDEAFVGKGELYAGVFLLWDQIM